MTNSDDKTAKEASSVDPNSMSAPDQQRVQELHSLRADAETRGDKKAVKDIDAQLSELTSPKN